MKKILLSLVALNLALPQIYASENEKVLEAVDVVESERRDDANYFAKELVKSTTRLNLTSRQTPQSLTVLTEARLKDQGIKDYQVLLRNVPWRYAKQMGRAHTSDGSWISDRLLLA